MSIATPAAYAGQNSLGDAHVADAMTGNVIHCGPETTLRAVARLMAEHMIHAVYVFDYGVEDDETTVLWGIVSDLDVAAAAAGDLDGRTARESAVTPLVTVSSNEGLEHAARTMAATGVTHLAVLDPVTRRPCGVISTLDIIRHVATP